MTRGTHRISLTFDDALDVHLDMVIPLLDRQGIAGTFFVTAGAVSFARRIENWRAAAAAGHELGNHTILHPAVRGKSYVTEGNAIERYTLDRMRLELIAANRLLQGVDGQAIRTFAYPCCNPTLGEPGLTKRVLRALRLDRTRLMGCVQRHGWLDVGSRETSYQPLVAELFLAARAGGERFSVGQEFPPPRFAVPCVSLDGKRLAQLEAVIAEFLRAEGGWLVFMAHGVGGGHRLSCDADVFEGLIRLLKAAPVSLMTFRNAARQIYTERHA